MFRQSRSGDYANASIRRQIQVERYGNHVVRKMLTLLARTETALIVEIVALSETSAVRAAFEARLEAIRAQQEVLATELKRQLADDAQELAAAEAQFAGRSAAALGVEFNGVTREQIRAAAMSRPFQGVHLKFANLDEHVDEFSRRRAALVRDTIRQGFLTGKGVDQVVRDLRGTRSQGYADGALNATRRTAETITRTALTHTAAAARDEVYIANDHLIAQIQFVAVIDARTTSICRTLNGQVFDKGKAPATPQHPNCRSTTIPVFKGDEPLKVPSYDDWLKRQPRGTVEEVLGVKRAALYLDGGLSVDRFVNDAGKEYTLAQLSARESAAFARLET